MKTKLYFVASAAVFLAGPAMAQEPLDMAKAKTPTTQNAPAGAAAPEPLEKAGTEPSATQPAPQPRAAAEPLDIGTLRKAQEEGKTVSQLNATVDRVEEMDIYDANGKKIAEVDSVLEDQSGQIRGIAIEYGGFLGFGEKGAVLTLDQVKQKDGNLITEMTEEQLPSLPAWTD